jgi:hypothetical protein
MIRFMEIWRLAVASKNVDGVLFEQLCLMVRKALRIATFANTRTLKPHYSAGRNKHFEHLVCEAHRELVNAFDKISTPVGHISISEGMSQEVVLPFHIDGRCVYMYMKALGALSDTKRMTHLMQWILASWDKPYILEGSKLPHELGHHYVCETFAYYARSRDAVDEEEMASIEESLAQLQRDKNCTWLWPSSIEPGHDVSVDQGICHYWPRIVERVGRSDGAGLRPTTMI